MKYRPVAVPLITVDPFFSLWSCDDALYSSETEHWTGRPCPIMAGIFVGDRFFSMSGFDITGKPIRQRIYQVDLKITPTASKYIFENEYARVKLTFRTPLLLDRLDILSRPVSYVEYEIDSKCDKPIKFVFGISTKCCVDDKAQCVKFEKTEFSLSAGNTCQSPLAQSDDTVMIDWGYLHLCDRSAMVGRFDKAGRLETLPINCSYNVFSEMPYIFVAKSELGGVITLAYDEIYPIEYFGKPLRECYTEYFDSFGDMARAAIAEHAQIKEMCEKFDNDLISMTSRYGDNYEKITSLAYRQAISAHKLVKDTEGNYLFLSKENESNGCVGTLDVTYPSIPLFLKFNPELVLGMLRPIIRFALSDKWKFDFPPHDVGQYPIANGQVYGLSSRNLGVGNRYCAPAELKPEMQMPVEEAGNMLICLAAVKKYSDGDTSLFDANRELMKKWADYLVEFGYAPENQLCTDDFAGHLENNCNLSLKAILGIAAYADLANDEKYMEIAREYAVRWTSDAKASHGATRLTFDTDDTWSLKYNIIWDSILGYSLFSDELKNKEAEFYLTKLNRYGVPLDCRSDYTKIDWLMWSTRIGDNEDYFNKVCESIVNMINETVDRVPLTDWYYTSTAAYRLFRNRTVVGGLFVKLL